MRPHMRLSILAAATLGYVLAAPLAAHAQSAPRILVPVSQSERLTLTGNVSGKLRFASDEGPAEPSRPLGRIMLMLRPSAAQQDALQQLLSEQQDRTSPNYRKWLTPQEYAARFGIADADLQTLTGWLVQQGFTHVEAGRTHRFLSFSGTVATAQSAFATQMHRVTLDGKSHIANVTAPSVPAAFSDLVSVVIGLDDFTSTALHGRPVALPKPGAGGEMTQTYFTPQTFAEEYDTTPLQNAGITGAGVTVVVVGQTAPSVSNLNYFQNIFGLPQSTPTIVPATVGGTGAASDAEEAALDLEWISAVAPGASLVYDFTGSSYTQALADAIDNDRGQIVSVSYGDCENYLTGNGANNNLPNAIDSVIQLGNALGITVVAASGDQGATCVEASDGGGTTPVMTTNEGLSVLFPATAPTVTAVGGTQFVSQFSSTSTYVPEQAWNETGTPGLGYLAASGGGASTVFSAPYWQNTTVDIPSGNTQRWVPDVALNASHSLPTGEPYEVIYGPNNSVTTLGETSAATASFAGVLALVQQYLLKKGIAQTPGLGNANPMLYEIFANQLTPSNGGNASFHDITAGNNLVMSSAGSQIGFSAGTGYDQVTGLGSVDVDQLATWWGYLQGTPSLSISPQVLTFPSQPQNTNSDPMTLTLTNSGQGLVAISGGLIPMGTNASSFTIETSNTTCGTQILPGKSCTITIVFKPKAAGELFAYLPIAGNLSAEIPLSGVGAAPIPSGTVASTYPFTIASPNTGYGGGPLIQASDGNFYGVNAYGGASTASSLCSQTSTAGGCGTIYKLNPQTGVYTLLYSFMNGSDGAYPSSLIQGPDGNLYGTALLGGLTTYPNGTSNCTTGCGTLFEYALNGTPPANALNAATPASVYEFGKNSSDGQNPGSLTLGADGRIYGTTLVGGTNGAGTIFVFTPENVATSPATPATAVTILHSLPGGVNGSYPETLVQGTSGLFYGMTQEVSGVPDYGSVFQVDTSGNYQTLYSFQSETDSANVKPPSVASPRPRIVTTQPSHAQGGGALAAVYATPKALVQYSDGNFYGTTAAPPPSTNSTIFKMTPTGALTTLYTFTGTGMSDDGGGSLYGLTLGSDANFYGVSGDVIFRMTPSGRLASLYTVSGTPDPQPGFLLNAADGSLVSATIGVMPGSNPENACPDSTSGSCGYVFDYVTSPTLTAPVQLSFSPAGPSSGYPNAPFTLNWQVLQATSLTAQQCYAFLSGGTGGGVWTGKQTGALVGSTYMGTATITPTAVGSYTYSLTCGGTLTGSVTVNISKLPAYVTLTASANSLAYGAPVTLTATVFNPLAGSLKPTGSVSFGNGVTCSYPSTSCANIIGSANLINGTASFQTTNASYPAGQSVVEFAAYYAGDANFDPYYTGQLIIPGDPLDSVGYVAVNVSSLLAPAAGFRLPTAYVGRSYSTFLTGVTGGKPASTGAPPTYTYTTTPGSLPANLSLSSNGQITGTPATAGSYQFTVTITDSTGDPPVTATAYVSVTANPLQLFLNPDASAGVPYTSGQIVSGGTPPYTYQVQGTLPPGLSFNYSTGILSGTPRSPGTFFTTYTVTDSEQPIAAISETIPLVVNVIPVQLSAAYCSGIIFAQVPFSCTLSGYGGNPPYTWTIAAGSLPAGLTLNSSTGVISGTPAVAGTSSFEVQEGTQLPPAVVTATIVVYAPLAVTTSILPTGEAGSPYGASLTASGGSSSYTWTLVSGTLPPGVSLNPNGIFSGSPTAPGTYPFTVELSDSNNTVPTFTVATATASLSITVNSSLAITSPPILPAAALSTPYNTTLTAAGGVSPYYWTIASGTHPPGLNLDNNTGVISGTPSAPGTFIFTVQVTDSESASLSQAVCIGVSSPCPAQLAPVALRFVPIPPCRVADTRNPTAPFGGPMLQSASSREFDIPSSGCAIPSTAAAYSLNITVVPPGVLGHLTVFPSGQQTVPPTSTMNSDGRTKANAAIVAAGVNGGVSLYSSDPTQAIIDIDGYFVPASASPTTLQFYPLAPCRIADTRSSNYPTGLGQPSLAGNTARAFPVLSSKCNIPSSAQAYSLNVTAVPANGLAYLTAYPTGQAQAAATATSTLNGHANNTTANAAIVSAGTGGQVSVFATDQTDVILDIDGYFAPPGSGGLSLYAISPCRILDTRQSGNSFPGTQLVNVESSSCAPPATAQAYVLNATVVPAGMFDYLTLWPSGTMPMVSTLNASDGAVTSNMALIPASNGSLDAYAPDTGNLILDIAGYFAP